MLPNPVEKPVLTLDEAGEVLGLGRSTIYEAAKTGQIPVRRINRRWLVPTEALLRWMRDTEATAVAQ